MSTSRRHLTRITARCRSVVETATERPVSAEQGLAVLWSFLLVTSVVSIGVGAVGTAAATSSQEDAYAGETSVASVASAESDPATQNQVCSGLSGDVVVSAYDRDGSLLQNGRVVLYTDSGPTGQQVSDGSVRFSDVAGGERAVELYSGSGEYLGTKEFCHDGYTSVDLPADTAYVTSVDVTDGKEGDGDGILEQGEQLTISVRVNNPEQYAKDVETSISIEGDSVDRGPLTISSGDSRSFGRDYVPDRGGAYDVEITVTADYGPDGATTDTYDTSFTVNSAPTSSINEPDASDPTIEVGEQVRFEVDASDTDGNLAGVDWSLDDDARDADSLSGYFDSSSWQHAFSSPGTYVVEANVFDSARSFNDEPARWTVEVVPPTGTLDVTAVDEDGNTVDDGRVRLYDSEYTELESERTDADGEVSFPDLETGQYIIELYGPNGDFWGVDTDVPVDDDGTRTTLQRTAPRLERIGLTDETNGDGTYLVGETINIGPEVRNDGAPRDVRVQIGLDTDNDNTAEETITRGDRSTEIATGDIGYYGYQYEPTSAGTKQVRVVTEAYLDGEWVPTDHSGWAKTFQVGSNEGDLTVTATDASGDRVENAGIVLYDDDPDGWNVQGETLTDGSGQAYWTGLEPGTYNLEMYSPDGEFWGTAEDVEVDTSGTSVTIQRTAPRLTSITLTDASDNGIYTVGETVNIGPEIRNDGTERPVRVQIEVDTDNDGAVDTNVTRGDQSTTISAESTGYYGYEFQPTEPGTKQVRVITQTYINGNWTTTDRSGWAKEFEVVAEDESGTIPVPRLDRSEGSTDIYVSETVVMGYPESHSGESYEWSVVSGPNESDKQLLHTSSDAPHNGRVTSFRPTDPGTYEIQVIIDGAETQRRELTVKEEAVWNGQSRSELLEAYAPVLKFHPEEDYYPTRYEAYVENTELNGTDTSGSDSLPTDATLLELWKYGNRSQYNSLRLEPEGTNYEEFQDPNVYPRTVYGSIRKGVEYQDREYTAIGYWMVYVNDPKPSHLSGVTEETKIARHVGDQEVFFVLVNRSGPQWVAASQHFGGEIRPWNRVQKEGNQPVMYPGDGAHSNFFGPYAGQGPIALNTAEESEFTPEYLYQTQYLCPSEQKLQCIGIAGPKDTGIRYAGSGNTDLALRALGYTDRIDDGSGSKIWSPEASELSSGEKYQIVHLSGNESWARYDGNVYYYPNKDDLPILDAYKGEIPQEQSRWSDDGLSEYLDTRLFSDYEQTAAEVSNSGSQTISVQEDEPIGDIVSIANDGMQPDDFVLTVTATNQSGTVITRTYSSFVNTGETRSIQQISSEIDSWETEQDRYTSLRDVVDSAWIKPERRSPSLPLTLPPGTWDVTVQLEMFDEDIQNRTQEPLGTETFTIKVEESDVDGEVRFIEEPSGLYGPGDDVNATVEVENTGEVEHTFFVGYSAQGPNKQFYDNDGTTGKPVTLAPGETATVDLSWTVDEGLPGGSYSLLTKVWEQSDPNNLQTAFDSDVSEDSIGLPPQPRIEEFRVERVTDDSIVINATATNIGSTAEWQSLAFSFPGVENADQVTVSDTNFEEEPLFGEPGLSVGSEYGTNRTELEYLLVEAAATDWETGETRYLELEVSRDAAGQEAYVKSIASADERRMWIAGPGPEDATATDQQSEYVYTLSLDVPVGEAPIASLTADPENASVGETVLLDASGSTDPDGDDSQLSYSWSVVSKPSGASVTQPMGPSGEVTFSTAGSYTFEVTVTDTDQYTDTATVTVPVEEGDSFPIADAGESPGPAPAGTTVELDGTGSVDPDGGSLTYDWLQSAGPTAQISDAETATPQVTIPERDEDSRVVCVSLAVRDDEGDQDLDEVCIYISPVADAGDDQTVTEGTTVELDARGSTDPDIVEFNWTQIAGPEISLSESETATPSFTAPAVDSTQELTFEVEVDDGLSGTATDVVTITVESATEQQEPEPICEGCNAPQDLDGDGKYEDLNGNGVQGFGDVITLFDNFQSESVTENTELYDYNNNGVVGFGDIIYLFETI